MTLDEAIEHCEEVATKTECESMCVEEAYQTAKQADCEKCAEEHRQIAEWLKELKEYREIKEKMENGAKKLHFVNNRTLMGLRDAITDTESEE